MKKEVESMKKFRVSTSAGNFFYDAYSRNDAVRQARKDGHHYIWAIYELTPTGEILVGTED